MSEVIIFRIDERGDPVVVEDSQSEYISEAHQPQPEDLHTSFGDLSGPEIASMTVVGLALGFAAIGGILFSGRSKSPDPQTKEQPFSEQPS